MDIKQSDLNIFMGVSEQNRNLKGFTGVEQAINTSYDSNKGMKKRNPFLHISSLEYTSAVNDVNIAKKGYMYFIHKFSSVSPSPIRNFNGSILFQGSYIYFNCSVHGAFNPENNSYYNVTINDIVTQLKNGSISNGRSSYKIEPYINVIGDYIYVMFTLESQDETINSKVDSSIIQVQSGSSSTNDTCLLLCNNLPEQAYRNLSGYTTPFSQITFIADTGVYYMFQPSTQTFMPISRTTSYRYKPFITYIDRDDNVKYVVMIYDGQIKIFDRHGNKANVSMQSSYLSSMQSADDIRVVSIADHLFILNRRVVPSMTGTIEDSFNFSAQGSLINLKQGQYGRTYQILSGSSVIAEHTTPNGEKPEMTAEISLTVIRDNLVKGLKKSGTSCSVGEGWIYIPNNTSIKTNDGFNNNAMWAINSSVQTFSKLPPDAPDGYTVEVSNEPDHNAKSTPYYIRYNGLKKVWKEIAKPNQNNSITNSSMPHELVREGNGSFTFRSSKWDKRLIGDDTSNDKPGFIDTPLTAITFHRDRLILATAESIYCSESGNYYNFWLTSTSNTLDSDPIDIGISSSQINLINHILPYDGQLYIFTNNAQFILQSETYLSPQTCALIEITTYPSTIKCPPIRRGHNMYFVAEKNTKTALFEYYTIMSTSEKKSAKNLSLQTPNLVPNGVYSLITNELNSNLFLLSEQTPNIIYVYSFPSATIEEMNTNISSKTPVSILELNGKWSKWVIQGEIIGGFISGDSLFIFVIHDNMLCLEKIYLISDVPIESGMPYVPYLDRLKWAVTATYEPKKDYTYFYPNKEYTTGNTFRVSENEQTLGFITPEGKYHLLTPQDFKEENIKNAVRLKGNYTNKKVLIGKPYAFLIKQTKCILKDNQTQLPIINKYIKIKQIEVSVADTGYLEILINVNEKSKVNNKIYRKIYTARNINNANNYIGVIPKDTDTFRVPVHLQQRKFSYTLFSAQPLPLTIDRVLVTYDVENNIQEV